MPIQALPFKRSCCRQKSFVRMSTMAAREVHDLAPPEKECENCASLDNLALCTRCRTAWFCSVKCQRAYWPFHKSACASNDFADALEHTEPRFARWMRKHGKVAVLKDDEVDRLERKVRGGGAGQVSLRLPVAENEAGPGRHAGRHVREAGPGPAASLLRRGRPACHACEGGEGGAGGSAERNRRAGVPAPATRGSH